MSRKIIFLVVIVTLVACSANPFPASGSKLTRLAEPLSRPPLAAQPVTPSSSPSPILSPAPIPAFETQPDYSTIQPLDHLAAPLPGPQTTRLPILEYHYSTFKMGEGVRMETAWFLEQLGWLHTNGFKTLTAEELVNFIHGVYNPPARSVVLTFDVGASKFDDYATIVIPALRQYNFHAVFFILASRTVDSCEDPDTTCWPMIKQWADEGLISVGSHSWSHIDYQTLAPEQIYLDAARSKALIEEKTGHPVLGICYPFDSVNPVAFGLLDSLGYQFAVGGYTQADRSVHFQADQPFALPRYYPYSGDYYPVIGGTQGQTFEQMLLGAVTVSQE